MASEDLQDVVATGEEVLFLAEDERAVEREGNPLRLDGSAHRLHAVDERHVDTGRKHVAVVDPLVKRDARGEVRESILTVAVVIQTVDSGLAS